MTPAPRPGAPATDAPSAGEGGRIGAEIKRWREERGLSQAQLAARVGVNPSVMSRHESGEVPDPRASFLHRVADVLDIPVWALLQAAGPARGPDPRALLRELALMMHERLPAALTRMPVPASTTDEVLRRAPRGPLTFWVYAAQPGEEGHSFCVVDVAGDGFAPLVRDGDDVVVDERALPRLGDLVLVRGRGTLFIRRVVGSRRGRPIVADPDGVPEKLGPHRVVVGVVVERRQRVARGTVPLHELVGDHLEEPDAPVAAVG